MVRLVIEKVRDGANGPRTVDAEGSTPDVTGAFLPLFLGQAHDRVAIVKFFSHIVPNMSRIFFHLFNMVSRPWR